MMIERVARALYNRKPLSGQDISDAVPPGKIGLGPVPWENAPKHEQTTFLNHARAMIEVMREPLVDMLIAAEQQCYLVNEVEIPNMWRAMIDAALEDGKSDAR